MASFEEPQIFGVNDLRNGEAVMYFSKINIGRLQSRLIISLLRRCLGSGKTRDRLFGKQREHITGMAGAHNFHHTVTVQTLCNFSSGQHKERRTVRHQRAVKQAQGICNGR